MNITFLIILLLLLIGDYLLRNLLKIPSRGIRGLQWYLLVSIFMIAFEASLQLTGTINALPHFRFLSLPFKFLIVPLLVLMAVPTGLHRTARTSHAFPALISFLILLPVYSLDGGEKLSLSQGYVTFIGFLSWALLLSNTFFLIRFFRQSSGKAQTDKRLSRVLLTAIIGFIILQVTGLIRNDFIPLFDLGSVCFLLLPLPIFGSNARDEAYDSDLLEGVREALEGGKLYLRPDLNLGMLASHLGHSQNEVSRAINSGLSIGFNDLINHHRVQEVIRLMQVKENHKYTLEGISRMAGFNSTTAFNKNFKKVTGKTPRQYKTMTGS